MRQIQIQRRTMRSWLTPRLRHSDYRANCRNQSVNYCASGIYTITIYENFRTLNSRSCSLNTSRSHPKTGEKGKAGTYEIAHPKVIQRLEWWDDSPVLRDSLRDSLRDIPTPVVVDVVVVEDEDVIGDKLKYAIENWHTRGVVPDGFCESVGVSHDELFNAPEGEVERMLGEFFGLNKFRN